MKVEVTQSKLKQTLNRLTTITSGSTQLPILSSVLVRVKKQSLSLSSTNLDIVIKEHLGGKIDGEGEVAVPAKLFYDCVQYSPEKNLELEITKDNKLKVSVKGSKTSTKSTSIINGSKAEDFPVVPAIEKKKKPWKIKIGDLSEAINKVSFAGAKDQSRQILNSGFLHLRNPKNKPQEIILVSTDAYRLASKKITNSTPKYDGKLALIIPLRSLITAGRIFGDYPEEDVLIRDEGGQISLELSSAKSEVPSIEFVSRLVDGEYVDYDAFLPTKFTHSFEVDKEELINEIKKTAAFARHENSNSIILDLKDGKLEIKAKASNSGENSSYLSNAKVKGEITITLNHTYLLEGINSIDGDKILFQINKVEDTRFSAGLITPQKDKEGHRYFVMPMKN